MMLWVKMTSVFAIRVSGLRLRVVRALVAGGPGSGQRARCGPDGLKRHVVVMGHGLGVVALRFGRGGRGGGAGPGRLGGATLARAAAAGGANEAERFDIDPQFVDF